MTEAAPITLLSIDRLVREAAIKRHEARVRLAKTGLCDRHPQVTIWKGKGVKVGSCHRCDAEYATRMMRLRAAREAFGEGDPNEASLAESQSLPANPQEVHTQQPHEEPDSRSDVAFSNGIIEPKSLARAHITSSKTTSIVSGNRGEQRVYVEEPYNLDILLDSPDRTRPGNERYWRAIEDAKPGNKMATSTRWNTMFATTKLSKKIWSQMISEGRRFLKWDASAKKYFLVSRPDASLKIAQALQDQNLAIAFKGAGGARRTTIVTAILEVGEEIDSLAPSCSGDSSSWFFGDTDSEGGFLECVPFPNWPMLFPYDEPTGISDHGWRSRSSSTIATLASEGF